MRVSPFRPFIWLLAMSVFGTAQSPSKLVVPGLRDEVTVRRDGRWIPYIEAKNDADLYFTQGYETARDRLFQMDLMRHLARGETAEIFGRSVLEEDKRWRRFNFTKIAEENLQYLSPELRTALDSYARGVNAYTATLNDKTLPIEFRILQYRPREWRASDTIVVGKILSDSLSTTWRTDLLRASLQNLPKDKLEDLTRAVTKYDVVLFGNDSKTPPGSAISSVEVSPSLMAIADAAEQVRRSSMERIGLYAEDLAASNNWVISGKRTTDGKPILANDPHLSPAVPGIWYLTHLSTPTMRVSGVTFPGVPGIILGHNEHIAWGATNVGPDVQDLYVETFNDKGEYNTPTGWKPATVRKEVINVRVNSLKTETEPVAFEVVETRNGPIILDEGGKKYALKWTAFDPHNTEFDAFYRWNRAKNWDDFKSGLKSYGGAAQNFIFADVKGNIGWYAASRIPIRRVGDGALPYDGATTDGDWIGFIPFEELPNLYNPADGLIVTANQRIVGTSYKYTQISRDAAPPWRSRRIYDELNARKKITMDDVRDIQHDVYNMPLVYLAKEVVSLGAASPATLEVLKAWDGRMNPDSRGALLINEIRNCTALKIAQANQPVPASIIRERILDWAVRERSARWLPLGAASYADLFKACDTAARVSFSDPKRFGPDEANWVWGKVWVSRFPHPLASAPLIGGQFAIPVVPISGSGQTPNVGSGVSMRHIASPGNWDVTRHVIPLGQSGDPASPHYKDQFDAWRTGTSMVFPFTRPAVERAATNVSVLSPR
ncbi:MAG: penicillin acylase family protein [Pyrinomonadaceae bacterium]